MNIDIAQHAVACKPVIKTVIQHVPVGVTYMHAVIASAISILAGFGIGWYVEGRGWFGVKTDASNAVKAVENVPTEVKTAIIAV